MRSVKLIVILIIFLTGCDAAAQKKDFHFKRKVMGSGGEGWYSLPLPPDIFHSINRDFSDLRIYQFKTQDTLEMPYLLHVLTDVIDEKVVELPAFNKSERGGKLFLTFELKNNQVNHLDLEFEQTNFNGYVQLQGGPDLKEWYTVDTPQRILSMKNNTVDFTSTFLDFPMTQYRYLRLQVMADKRLTLVKVSFKKIENVPGIHHELKPRWSALSSRETKATVLEVTLDHVQPVNSISINAENNLDFYRRITIEALRDSTQTPKGWAYYYDHLYSGYLTSLHDNHFYFPYTLAKKFLITVSNEDNPPLSFKALSATGPQVELLTKLTQGDSYLFYGNASIPAPVYDLVHFKEKIPEHLAVLSLEQEENLTTPITKTSPLFESKLWLWAIIGVMIGVLGYFTLNMMREKG